MTEKILAVVFVFIESLIAFAGYGGIVILMGIESACIPLPSELIMPFAGYLVFEGKMRLLWVATFTRWGYLAVFVGRLLPIVRTFIALPAGISRMPRLRFHIYTFLGSWPWCFGLAWLGMKLGENWRALGKYLHKFDAVIVIVLVVGIVWFIWTHWQNRLRTA
ncbi:MAG: alkaline phosphatase [Acidobacteria bacterium]|nr:MAG: alkaline phosphatase [Acidobacteriota bacterium]